MSDLIRYGIQWNGPREPISVELSDGYWTPWHVAEAEIVTLRQQLAAERQKRCGTCAYWAGSAAHDGYCENTASACWGDYREWPADHGCPHYRGKEAK